MNADVWLAARWAAALAAAMGSAVPAAHAQEPANRERASIVLGAFVTEPEITARVDSSINNAGTELNLGDDLGLETSATVARLGGYYWFSRRHRLDTSWFSLSLDGGRTIDETIEFGDEIFTINTRVETRADLDIIQASYTFAALIRERSFLGISGGMHTSKTGITLAAPVTATSESDDVTAPLPVIGVRGDWQFAEQWTLRAAWQWFGIEIDDIDGHLTDTYVAVDYGFRDRFAVGLAFNDTGLDVEQERRVSSSSLNWGYDGWMLYFKTDFGRSSR
jgi:hypothetical protein